MAKINNNENKILNLEPKTTLFSILGENMILKEQPTISITKESILKMKENLNERVSKSKNLKKKIFLKLFTNEEWLESNFKISGEDLNFEIGSLDCSPYDIISVLENNILNKISLALSLISNKVLENYSEYNGELDIIRNKFKDNSEEELYAKIKEITNKYTKGLSPNLITKNNITVYAYCAKIDENSSSINFKTKNKVIELKKFSHIFLCQHPKTGNYGTNSMMLNSGLISQSEFLTKFKAMSYEYNKLINVNFDLPENCEDLNLQPNFVILRIKFDFGKPLKELKGYDGTPIDYFQNSSNIFYIIGNENRSRFDKKLDEVFGD